MKKIDALIRELCSFLSTTEGMELIQRMDVENRLPSELLKHVSEMGLLGLTASKENNGLGLKYSEIVKLIEATAKFSPALAHILSVHNMALGLLDEASVENSALRKLVRQGAEDTLIAVALTEPGAGTDLAAVSTKAERTQGFFKINGEKIFTTNALYAGLFLTLARTGSPEERHKGLSLFVVEKEMGVKIVEPLDLMGFRGAGLARVVFKEAKVPKENIVGREGEGFKLALTSLASGRIMLSAVAVGLAQGALEEAVKHALSRKAFNKPIIEHQGVGFTLAEMATRVEAARRLVYTAADARDKGDDITMISSMAKLFSAQTAVDVVRDAIQVMGGYGLMRRTRVEKLYRDAKALEIAEGTNEAQKIVISRYLAKLYR